MSVQVATRKQGGRRSRKINFSGGLDSCPCLVLNADYQPLSYLPLRQVPCYFVYNRWPIQ